MCIAVSLFFEFYILIFTWLVIAVRGFFKRNFEIWVTQTRRHPSRRIESKENGMVCQFIIAGKCRLVTCFMGDISNFAIYLSVFSPLLDLWTRKAAKVSLNRLEIIYKITWCICQFAAFCKSGRGFFFSFSLPRFYDAFYPLTQANWKTNDVDGYRKGLNDKEAAWDGCRVLPAGSMDEAWYLHEGHVNVDMSVESYRGISRGIVFDSLIHCMISQTDVIIARRQE